MVINSNTPQMALSHWDSIDNLQTWWLRMTRLQDSEYGIWIKPELTRDPDRNSRHDEHDNIGIAKDLGDLVCAFTFENDIAELSLEIAQPMIQEIAKDTKAKFSDKVGTVGM